VLETCVGGYAAIAIVAVPAGPCKAHAVIRDAELARVPHVSVSVPVLESGRRIANSLYARVTAEDCKALIGFSFHYRKVAPQGILKKALTEDKPGLRDVRVPEVPQRRVLRTTNMRETLREATQARV
jgi:hypothetical protein